MRIFPLVISVFITSVVNAQCYTSLTQSQNKLLDKYGIDYTGLQTRYIMSTDRINNITDSATKIGMIDSYSKFLEWNHGKLQIIPDSNLIIETAAAYLKNKILTEDAELLRYFANDSHKILQKVHFDINQDGIKSIEIIELHMTGYKTCTYIYHMLFIEYENGYWSNYSSDDNDVSLDCPFCTVP